MKRYIIDIKALEILGITTNSAVDELSQSKIITNEALHFDSSPHISVMLSIRDAKLIGAKGFYIQEEAVGGAMLGADYEKVRSFYVKEKKKAITGAGVKVAVIDTGCNPVVLVPSYSLNVIDANPGITDNYGHGSRTASIIAHPLIGLAPNCEFHIIKAISDTGSMTESAALAAFDYVLANNIDFVSCSWTFYTSTMEASINACTANGTVVCAASGNNTDDTYTLFPATSKNVVAVNVVPESGLPWYKNWQAQPGFIDSHGVTVACSGIACEQYNNAGVYTSGYGTSFACPYFVGMLACYKEELGISDNRKVLEYALSRASKSYNYSKYYGAGVASF